MVRPAPARVHLQNHRYWPCHNDGVRHRIGGHRVRSRLFLVGLVLTLWPAATALPAAEAAEDEYWVRLREASSSAMTVRVRNLLNAELQDPNRRAELLTLVQSMRAPARQLVAQLRPQANTLNLVDPRLGRVNSVVIQMLQTPDFERAWDSGRVHELVTSLLEDPSACGIGGRRGAPVSTSSHVDPADCSLAFVLVVAFSYGISMAVCAASVLGNQPPDEWVDLLTSCHENNVVTLTGAGDAYSDCLLAFIIEAIINDTTNSMCNAVRRSLNQPEFGCNCGPQPLAPPASGSTTVALQ